MFDGAAAFSSNLSGWNVGNVSNMEVSCARTRMRRCAHPRRPRGFPRRFPPRATVCSRLAVLILPAAPATQGMFQGAAAFDTAKDAPWYKG